MMIREPIAAGRFYSASRERCLAELGECLQAAMQDESATQVDADRIIGGILPHAGWICSGAVAGRVVREIGDRHAPAVAIVFGAVHVPHVARAAVFPSGAWETPLGLSMVDDRLIHRICGHTGALENNPHAHDDEHSIEVEVPFVQHLLGGATIVPIMVPVTVDAVGLGGSVGRTCRDFGADCVFLASTDLTHYGPAYGFAPHGVGPDGIRWAREVNDRRMIELMLAMRERDAIKESVMNRNACGGGAIAATLAACKAYGASRAALLTQTTSHDVLTALGHAPGNDSVGYAGIVFFA
jgi:hypothetical protein